MAIIVENTRFPCHRVILCMGSPVFKVIFQNGMRESQAKEIPLIDVSKKVWPLILKHIYTKSVDFLNNGNAAQILEIANRFDIAHLENAATELLTKNSSPVTLLNIGDRLQLMVMKEKALTTISKNFYNHEKNTPSRSSSFFVLKIFKKLPA